MPEERARPPDLVLLDLGAFGHQRGQLVRVRDAVLEPQRVRDDDVVDPRARGQRDDRHLVAVPGRGGRACRRAESKVSAGWPPTHRSGADEARTPPIPDARSRRFTTTRMPSVILQPHCVKAYASLYSRRGSRSARRGHSGGGPTMIRTRWTRGRTLLPMLVVVSLLLAACGGCHDEWLPGRAPPRAPTTAASDRTAALKQAPRRALKPAPLPVATPPRSSPATPA